MNNNCAHQPSETEVLQTFAFIALTHYSDKTNVSINELFKRFSENTPSSQERPIIDSLAYVVWSCYIGSMNGEEINRDNMIDWALRIGKLHGYSSPIDTDEIKSDFEHDGIREAVKDFPTYFPNHKTVTPKLELEVMPWLKERGVIGNRQQRLTGKTILKHFGIAGKRGRPKKLT